MTLIKDWYYLAIIFLVGVILYIVNLETMAVEIMEARNFVTVREIIQSGDWLHPTMNGELRLEKPPLPTWITAIFASIFGLKNIFFLRLPAALMSIWMLFSMNSIVKRITHDKLIAMLSSLALAGMLYVVLLGRRGTWDIYTHSFMLAFILQFLILLKSKFSLIRAIWAGLLFGAAFLSKGPVSLYAIFLPFAISYFAIFKDSRKKVNANNLFVFLLIALVVSASWFLFIYLSIGNESEQVIGKEINNWSSYNVRPWYYYLKDYPVHSGIWTLILAIGLFTKYNYNRAKDKREFLFFWVWTAMSIVLLSLIPEKKIRYLFPTFIPASYLVASYFKFLIEDYKENNNLLDRIILKINTSIFTIVAIALPILMYIFFYNKGIIGLGTIIGVSIFSIVCIYIFLQAWNHKKSYYLLLGSLLLLGTSIIFVVPNSKYMLNPQFKSIEAVLDIDELEGIPAYALESTRIELVWGVGRKVKEVENLNDLQPPYMLLTNEKPKEYNITRDYKLIGHYDNNSKPEGHKYHHKSQSKYVSIVY